MAKPPGETPVARNARFEAAYERGWVDSLRAHNALSCQPALDKYYYQRGWHDCADYRWKDPEGRGVAPDPTYRPAVRLDACDLRGAA